MTDAHAPLSDETEFFETQKESLLANHEDQFALVIGRALRGTFTTEKEAYEAGLSQVGNRPFLIRQIRREEPELQVPVLFVGIPIGAVSQ